ncbi:Ybl54 (modular protein) [Flavobacterium psychrophilum]|nr:Ybl54 (modular protein) [Flavobacterium psychrophilum]SNB01671.1 Ybl54 (modular protein) [Flavobacterium psychrophilum]SNB12624.1 Ybl54 (modular protein) [Flavobacterium psychrophilum]SNB15453.1 Ybl54 (modular protein) [Flavobacterium psychrophilum]SNB16052.1 Ybl54 (modular protein) [Flavobacterium psychrophilum]
MVVISLIFNNNTEIVQITELKNPKHLICKRLGFLLSREEGIRTLDMLPYTRFPSVRLQPLGHLSLCFANKRIIFLEFKYFRD